MNDERAFIIPHPSHQLFPPRFVLIDMELEGQAMKRALLVVFVVSLISISLFGANGGVHQSAALTNVRALSLEHAAGSWHMQIKCDQGVGTISMIDSREQPVYRKTKNDER
jgi:hypothetical protein